MPRSSRATDPLGRVDASLAPGPLTSQETSGGVDRTVELRSASERGEGGWAGIIGRPINEKWVLLCEFYSNWCWTTITTPQGYQTPQTVLGVFPAIEFLATEKFSLTAGTSFDLLGKNGVRKYTPMLSLYYAF